MTHTLEGNCESCLMPFNKDPKKENREHANYCSYCYFDGKLAYAGNDVKEFKNAMYKAIVARGENKLKAYLYTFMAGFAPRWQKKKNS